jgi:hypothetical protein
MLAAGGTPPRQESAMGDSAVQQAGGSRERPFASGGGRVGIVGRLLHGDSGRSGDFSIAPLSWLASGTGLVALLLFAAQQSLRLPAGFGIEDLLGWSALATLGEAIRQWCGPQGLRWYVAAGYVLADTALFMPLYAVLLLATARALGQSLRGGTGDAEEGLHLAWLARGLRAGLMPVTWALILLLLAVDAVENLGGARRLGVGEPSFHAALIVGASAFLALWRWATTTPAQRDKWLCFGLAGVAAAMLFVGFLVLQQDGASVCVAVGRQALLSPDLVGTGLSLGAQAHRLKSAAVVLALLPIAFAAVVWWFGLDLDLNHPPQYALAQARAARRAGASGVVGRSRYVLLALGLFAVFTLVLEQCRDVMLGLARPASRAEALQGGALAWRIVVLAASALATGLFAYSCWQWTRLVGRVQRPGLNLVGHQEAPGAETGESTVAVLAWVGEFARGWARALALAPLAMFCVLIAYAVGDAVSAAQGGGATPTAQLLPWTVAYLIGFGVGAVLIGFFLLQLRRQHALSRARDYYNAEPDVYRLLWGADGAPRVAAGGGGLGGPVFEPRPRHCVDRCRDAWARHVSPHLGALAQLGDGLTPWTRPVALPLVALALMLALRAGMAWWPAEAAQAPATLALVALALCWWLGVAGVISLAEQRQAVPWGLALLGVVGLLALPGWTDHHVLALGVGLPARPAEADLDRLRHHGLAATALLAGLGLLWWGAATYSREHAPFKVWPGASAQRFVMLRVAVALVAGLGVVAGLHALDRSAQQRARVPTPLASSAPLANPWREWALSLPAPTPADHRLYLVASEGGGIRSAYWTAQVLARLHDELPGFDQRTVALSGVSGGAVGEALYRACLRLSPRAVRDCLEARFDALDPLSPLIGAFLFEDAFARVLPMHIGSGVLACKQAGCGHLSRALGFEREWTRSFPTLAEDLGPARPGEPALVLNSTWVESGNRAVLATLASPAGTFPAGVDVVQRLGVQPSLIAAAHAAARFPFINPLAAVAPASGAPIIQGHLADGGYHDNSGAASLADLWQQLQPHLRPGWQPVLVLIRNGQKKPGCETPRPGDTPPPRCMLPGASVQDLAKPLDRPRWNLYVDLLGPAVAVLNVSGIGAHGRQPAAALASTLAPWAADAAGDCRSGPVWLIDQIEDGALVPLGWYLSPAARDALDSQAERSTCPQ